MCVRATALGPSIWIQICFLFLMCGLNREFEAIPGYQNDYNSAVFCYAMLWSLLLVRCSNCVKCCEKTKMDFQARLYKNLEMPSQHLITSFHACVDIN